MSEMVRDYGDDPAEAEHLESLIAHRLREVIGQNGGPELASVEGLLRTHDAFLRYRFGGHLRNYRRFAGKYSFAFSFLSVATIVSGLASAGIAAGWSGTGWARWLILVLGIVAGVAAAVNQLWRPGEKAVSRMRGANLLCGEAWAFLERRGRYRLVDGDHEAFGLFVDEVSRIIQQAAAVDEARIEPPQLPPG